MNPAKSASRERPSPPFIDGLFDAHCHLDYEPMAGALEDVLARAGAAGVTRFLHIGCAPASFGPALALAARDEIYVSLGVHPHEAASYDDAVEASLRALRGQSTKIVALGETGLDYFYDHACRETQRETFVRQIELAGELDLPLVLHIRDAHDEALDLIRPRIRRDAPGMVHCFTGDVATASRWLDLGFCISFSGIATFPKAAEIREAAQFCPSDRILLETDAPYLAPVPLRGKKNEPANVAFTCEVLAHVRGVPARELARTATQNTCRLLGLGDGYVR